MQKRTATLIIFLFSSLIGYAQYPVFSHLDWMQTQFNPSFLGVNRQEKILLDYNNSWISNEVNSKQGVLQYDRAFIRTNDRNLGGIGVSIFNNRVDYKEVFNRFQASASAAYAVSLSNSVYLNLGLQGSYHDDNVNNAGLLTGSQYVPGRGFDPGIGSNEPGTNQKVNYFGLSTGLFLYQETDDVLPDNYFGFSVMNINRPVNSFYEQDSRLAPQFNVMGGIRILEGMKSRLLGEAWYNTTNQRSNVTLGAIYHIDNLINTKSGSDDISMRMVSRYSLNHKFVIGAQLLFPNVTAGFTYDIPIPDATERTYDTGFEILLAFHRKVKGSKRSKKPKYQKADIPPEMIMIPVAEEDTVQLPPLENIEQEDTVELTGGKIGRASAGEVIEDKPIRSIVYFNFASRDITIQSETLIREIIAQFNLQGKNMIVITGHTDHVGSRKYNQRLSLQRAESVRQKLILFGINEDQIIADGKGEEEPLVPNDTDENRAINRRVEITFY